MIIKQRRSQKLRRRSIVVEGTLNMLGSSLININTLYSKKCYRTSVFQDLIAVYLYYGGNNYFESKTILSPEGNYTHYYIDENFNSQGFGRVGKEVHPTPDADGARSFTYTYYPNSAQAHYKYCYSGSDFTNLILRYEYNSGGNSISPVPDFTASPVTGKAPLTVSFANRSTGSISFYAWDFGDGQTSSEKNPTHVYTNAGDYAVVLTAGGPPGSNTRMKTIHIG